MADRGERLLQDLLLAAAERDPAALAVASPGARATYRELLDASRRLGSTLVSAGVGPGDRVAIAMMNGVPAVVSTFASLFAGGAFVLVNPEATRDTLDAILRTSGATVLVTETAMAAQAAGVRDRV
ncbi:MAG: AMP-binding protein, partial [Actinomycetota bacterium]